MCNIDIKIRGLEKPTLKEFKNWFDYLSHYSKSINRAIHFLKHLDGISYLVSK